MSDNNNKNSFGPIKSFFLFCAGINPLLLQNEKFREDSTRYAAIGASVFMTGLLAFVSGSYAFSKIFGDEKLSLVLGFGFIWACFIFSMDRLIVMSIDKNDSSFKQFLKSIPRIALAMLIAITISKPLELRIFEKKIKGQLTKQQLIEERENKNLLEQIIQADSNSVYLSELKDDRKRLDSILNSKITNIEYQSFISKKDQAENSMRTIKAKITKANNQLKRLKNKLNNPSEVLTKIQKAELKTKIKAQGKKVDDLWESYYPKERSFNTNKMNIEDFRASYFADLNKEKAEIDSLYTIALLKETLGRNRLIIQGDSIKQASKENNENDLIAEIQALHDLRGQTDAKTGGKNTIWWTSNLIMLLLMMIETVPVFAKLFMKRGEYDLHKVYEMDKRKDEHLLEALASRISLIEKKAEGLSSIKERIKEERALKTLLMDSYHQMLQKELDEFVLIDISNADFPLERKKTSHSDQQRKSAMNRISRLFFMIQEIKDESAKNEILKDLATKVNFS